MVIEPGRHLCVIIVAAGKGSRFGSDTPKQFLPLKGRPVVMHAIDAFRAEFPEARIILVLSPDGLPMWQELCSQFGYESPLIVYGGETRSHSVANALEAAQKLGIDDRTIIMVHDGARPIVNRGMIRSIYSMNFIGPPEAIVPGTEPTDSLVESSQYYDVKPVPRRDYSLVQTPQSFRAPVIIDAYRKAAADDYRGLTDEASVVAKYSETPILVLEGDPNNIKITRPADIEIARILMDNPMPYWPPGAI